MWINDDSSVTLKPVKTETSKIEELVAEVRSNRARRGAAPLPKSGWKAVAGTVADDALYREAARLGEEWRKAANEHR